MTKSQWVGVAAGATAATSWASATILSKHLLQDFHPVSLLLVQLSASVATLWGAVAIRSQWVSHKASPFKLTASFAWLGVLEPATAYLLCLSGLVAATASGATLIQASESIMIVAITALMTRVLPSWGFLGFCLVALIGLYFAVGIDSSDSASTSAPLGIAFLAAGTLSAALYVVLSGRVARRAAALTITAWQQSVALVLVVLVALAVRVVAEPAGLVLASTATRAPIHGGNTLLVCAASGLLQFALPFCLYMIALQRLTPNLAGGLLLLTPVVGLLEAHVFLGESLSSSQWLGSVVVLAAVAALGFVGTARDSIHAPCVASSVEA